MKKFIYEKVFVSTCKMVLKQISLCMPDMLLKESKSYSKKFGYKNVQELILDLLRKNVLVERYYKIESKMNNKKLNKKEAVEFVKGL